MTTQSFKDDCERWIEIDGKGRIKWQSMLKKTHVLSPRDWDHLFTIIEDSILDDYGEERIDWWQAWKWWDADQEGPQ